MQKVVRTVPTRKGYWYDEEKMKYLSELLKNGWKAVSYTHLTLPTN